MRNLVICGVILCSILSAYPLDEKKATEFFTKRIIHVEGKGGEGGSKWRFLIENGYLEVTVSHMTDKITNLSFSKESPKLYKIIDNVLIRKYGGKLCGYDVFIGDDQFKDPLPPIIIFNCCPQEDNSASFPVKYMWNSEKNEFVPN